MLSEQSIITIILLSILAGAVIYTLDDASYKQRCAEIVPPCSGDPTCAAVRERSGCE